MLFQEKLIKKEINDFLEKTNLDLEIKDFKIQDQTVCLKLQSSEPQILIGERGQTLIEFQYLLRIVLNKKLQSSLFVDLDINDYKEKKTRYLKELAKNIADEVILTKKEKELEPMPSYERRIVHLALSEREGVATQSIGEREDRRIIIKPMP